MQNALLPIITIEDAQENANKFFDLLDAKEATIKEYKLRIPYFLQFTQKHGINYDTFLEFKRHLADRTDWSISTKNKYLGVARMFLKELNKRGALPVDITQNVKVFSRNKKHTKDGVNEEEMQLLVEKLRQLEPTPQNARLKAMFSLLVLQGLRQVEITRLDVKDLDLVGKTAMVLGKGRDDKEKVSLHPETVKALKGYLKTNRKGSGPLFTSISNHHNGKRLTTRAVRKIITEFLKDLGIERSVHGFRHYFVTTLVKTYKGDLLEVAQYTRHRGLEMLQVYNDAVKKESDLPRFYNAFKDVNFQKK